MRSLFLAALVDTASSYCNWNREVYRSNDCTGTKTTDSITDYWGDEIGACKKTNLDIAKGGKLVSCSSTSVVYDYWSTDETCASTRSGTFTLNAIGCKVDD